MKIINQLGSKVLVALVIECFIGILAIQNDQTSSRSSQEDIVLSASAYTGPERTSSVIHRDGSLTFQRTVPAFQLESSKSVHNVDKDYVRFADTHTNREESLDELVSSKHVDHIDGNNIEVKPAEYYHIVPTTSESISGEEQGAPQGRNLLTEPHQQVGVLSQRGQYFEAMDQRRRARHEISRIYSEHAPPPILQTASPGQRQANPDIQDIITGIVKLLNGNVNIAANTVRPLRPVQATRINNRGPPKISDVPPLPPDFDTPGMNPPPPPYHSYNPDRTQVPHRPSNNQLTSDRPDRPFIHGVPLPEQIVPPRTRPWTSNRPGGNKRPIPTHKPIGPHLDSTFHRDKIHTNNDNNHNHPDKSSFDSKPDAQSPEGISTKKEETNHYETTTSVHDNVTNRNESELSNVTEESSSKNVTKKHESEEPTKVVQKDHSSTKENKVNSEKTLVLGVNPDDSYQTTETKSTEHSKSSEMQIKPTKSTKSDSKGSTTANESSRDQSSLSKSSIKTSSATTLNIDTSSSVQEINPSTTRIVQSTTIPEMSNSHNTESTSSIATVTLEPSKPPNFETINIVSSVSTPTEVLPSTYTTISTTSEKSIVHTPAANTFSKNPAYTDRYSYRPRPGIVLDDTLDYTGSQGLPTQGPYVPSRYPPIGDIFDVTLSVIQGPGNDPAKATVNAASSDVILTTAVKGQGSVSIDGRRTYLNLFENTDQSSAHTNVQPQPTRTQPPAIIGTGVAVPQPDTSTVTSRPAGPLLRPPFSRRPTQPPIRIDTCIVGDTSTCDASQHEACATVQGVSACHCKPGYARMQHSSPCKKIISIVVSIRVDRIYDRKVVWDRGLGDKDSEFHQTLAYEANRAIGSAMSMTPFSDQFMASLVNGIYHGDVSQGQGGVFVNATLKLAYDARIARPSFAVDLQRQLLGVIERRSNNIGNSALYVDSLPGSISNLQDLDECASSELNDCHSSATCTNTWGGFTCACNSGLKDPHKDNPNESGRSCMTCPSTYCNNRGSCSYQGDQMQCSCTGNYYGAQCEVDGEVLGVAIGASVAALIIIVLTLVCLVMWSRRWSREQKSVGSPVYGYIQGGIPATLPGTLARVGSVGTLASVKQGPPTNLPPYMWAHFGDHMATANVYATEPMGPTRPSSAVFGYPPINVHGTLPPVPLPRLQAPPRARQRHQADPDSSDSEMQDKDRADLIPQSSGFHVPRPKSRSSLANQSGIYNDVEYDQGDVHHLSKNNIPMSTYRPYYRT